MGGAARHPGPPPPHAQQAWLAILPFAPWEGVRKIMILSKIRKNTYGFLQLNQPTSNLMVLEE